MTRKPTGMVARGRVCAVADSGPPRLKKAFNHFPVSLDQPLPLHVQKGKKLPGEGVSRVFPMALERTATAGRAHQEPERADRRRRGSTFL